MKPALYGPELATKVVGPIPGPPPGPEPGPPREAYTVPVAGSAAITNVWLAPGIADPLELAFVNAN
jgi:hypothetical protein